MPTPPFDRYGRPVVLLFTEKQTTDHRGAAMMLPHLPRCSIRWLLAQCIDIAEPLPFRQWLLCERKRSRCARHSHSRHTNNLNIATVNRCVAVAT